MSTCFANVYLITVNVAASQSIHHIRSAHLLGGLTLRADSCSAEDLLKSSSEAEIKISARVLRNCQKHGFQIDLLLVHPRHGLVAFEVKFGKTTETEKQVRTHKRNLLSFMQKIFGDNQPVPSVTLVICCPNRQVGENITSIDGLIHKIGLDHYQSQPAFSQRMEEILSSQSGSGENWFTQPVFQQLFTLQSGYKAANICHATSSLEVYRKIASMEAAKHLKGHKKVEAPFHPSGGMETIFLSPEQQRILENPIQHQIIWGAPGSGKTLLVMLSVLDWCQRDGPGKVVVYVGREELKLKYDRFFQASQENGIEFKRQPEVVQFHWRENIPILSSENSTENDVALDEGLRIDGSKLPDLFGDQIVGRRFIAITGNRSAKNIPRQSSALLAPGTKPSNLVITELRTIFRGTTSIINEWKQRLEEGYGDKLTVAHHIAGQPVTRREANTTEQLGAMVEQCINEATCGASCSSTNMSDIAVLYGYPYYDLEGIVLVALTKRGIRWQSIEDSVQHPDSGAVVFDEYYSSMSYEWNTVIAVIEESYRMLIPASRAIAKLFIVDFDLYAYGKTLADEYEKTYGTDEPIDMGKVKESIRRTYEDKGWGSAEEEMLEEVAGWVQWKLEDRKEDRRREADTSSSDTSEGAS